MKRFFILVAIMVASSFLLIGCGAAKRAQKSPVSTFVMPGSEYKSGDGVIRAWGMGKSNNESVARKKAQVNASSELAASLQQILAAAVDEYSADLEEGKYVDSKTLMTASTSSDVNQTLSGAVIVYDRWSKDDDTGVYTNYIVLELKGEQYLQSLYKGLGDSSSKIDKELLEKKFYELIDEDGK